jgi:ADP-dependent NAD(P)H-hydrate dehydratase / NAD(P)H-hydrate epimerase
VKTPVPKPPVPSHPVLSAEQAGTLEASLFAGDERLEWKAMLLAGRSTAEAVLGDFAEIGPFPSAAHLLVLAGKGNNAGDALIAARDLLGRFPGASCDVLFAFGPRKLKPLASKAWRGLSEACRGRVRSCGPDGLAPRYDLCLDGIFGYQFRPPLPAEALGAIAAADRCEIRLRAAVDLPSGLDGPGAFRADFTYATGIAKSPILGCASAGRPRYLDLGFFSGESPGGAPAAVQERILLPSLLAALGGLRPASADKRSQGHLAIVGGSDDLPGAVLMATLAALRSGAGLVTAFVPERLAPLYAARAPEAMWVGLPVTASGGLSLRGLPKIQKIAQRATAMVIGPGLGKDPKTHSLAMAIVRGSKIPLVIDADALQPDIVRAGKARRILTPHAGELARIAMDESLRKLCRSVPAVVIAKAAVTRVCEGGPEYLSLHGGPVLSRGGSGDLLAGLTGGLLAQTPADPMLAACRATVWHGVAADLLARAHGQTAVEILQWLDFLAPALRETPPCPAS